MDAWQIELLEIQKRRVAVVLCLAILGLIVVVVLRFVPRLNDALSGQPQYIRILTETFARQLAAQIQMQSPVIVEHDENETCQAVAAPAISDDHVRGTLYLLTYSDQQRLSCITTYIVPVAVSDESSLRTFTPAEGKNYGPRLVQPVNAFPETRIIHTYASEYLKRLHWRYKPHFPLSPSEAENLKSHSAYSGVKPAGDSVSIDFDYGELRAEVTQRHDKVNWGLSVLLIGCGIVVLIVIRKLTQMYRTTSQYCRMYQSEMTAWAFLKENISTKLTAARREYFERQQQTQARVRDEQRLRVLRNTWEEGLRVQLPNLTDEQLRSRVQECLARETADLQDLRSLWVEVQERTAVKTPADKIALLLESVKPYCTEEELLAGRAEAFAILSKSGFRAARTFAITMHEQFKVRAREMEELEEPEQTTS